MYDTSEKEREYELARIVFCVRSLLFLSFNRHPTPFAGLVHYTHYECCCVHSIVRHIISPISSILLRLWWQLLDFHASNKPFWWDFSSSAANGKRKNSASEMRASFVLSKAIVLGVHAMVLVYFRAKRALGGAGAWIIISYGNWLGEILAFSMAVTFLPWERVNWCIEPECLINASMKVSEFCWCYDK